MNQLQTWQASLSLYNEGLFFFFFWTDTGTSGKLPLSVEEETSKAGIICELESEKVEVCFQVFLYFSKGKLAAGAIGFL